MSNHTDRPDQDDAGASRNDEGVPVCPKCFTPYPPYRHYCHNCGATIGQYTPYIPFVNIPFLANFYGRLWRRVWYEKGVPLYRRFFALLLILLFAPIMLIGLPFVLWEKRRARGRARRDEPTRSEGAGQP